MVANSRGDEEGRPARDRTDEPGGVADPLCEVAAAGDARAGAAPARRREGNNHTLNASYVQEV